MTKKNNNLINEGVVRRWGKLANLSTLTESYLEDITEADEEEGEEEELEVEVPLSDEAPPEDEMDAEMDPEMAAEMGAEMGAEMEEPSLDLDEDQVEQIAQIFFDTLEQATDGQVEFEVSTSEDEADAEAPAEEMMDEEPAMMDEPVTDEDPAMRYEELEKINVIDDEELTESVLARVIERLLKNK